MIYEELLSLWLEESDQFHGFGNLEKISEGTSSNVYRISSGNGESLILKHAISDDFVTKKNIFKQYEIQNYLYDKFPVAKPIYYSVDNRIFEYPLLIMEDLPGKIKNDENSVKMSFKLINDLHSIKLDQRFDKKKKGKNYIGYLINKLYKQYKSRMMELSPDISNIFIWLMNNYPENNINCLTHNDWKMSNILFDNDKVSGVLDWELFDVSDPRMDLGIAMAYWPEKEWISIEQEYGCDRQDIINTFNMTENEWTFFEVLGIFRLIAIAQLQGVRHNKDIHDKIYIAKERCERIINNNGESFVSTSIY